MLENHTENRKKYYWNRSNASSTNIVFAYEFSDRLVYDCKMFSDYDIDGFSNVKDLSNHTRILLYMKPMYLYLYNNNSNNNKNN